MTKNELKDFFVFLKSSNLVKNKTDFANKIEYGRQYATEMINGNRDITTEFEDKVLSHFGAEWNEFQQMVRSYGYASTKRAHNIGTPLVSSEAAAGFGNSHFCIKEEDIQARYTVPDFNGIDFMIRVKGASMYPKYSSGDIVACRILKESRFIQWNKPYVISTKEQGMLCKRLMPADNDECLQLVSDNADYPAFEVPKDEISGIALIVGVIRLE